jgi:hypothetical protein
MPWFSGSMEVDAIPYALILLLPCDPAAKLLPMSS